MWRKFCAEPRLTSEKKKRKEALMFAGLIVRFLVDDNENTSEWSPTNDMLLSLPSQIIHGKIVKGRCGSVAYCFDGSYRLTASGFHYSFVYDRPTESGSHYIFLYDFVIATLRVIHSFRKLLTCPISVGGTIRSLCLPDLPISLSVEGTIRSLGLPDLSRRYQDLDLLSQNDSNFTLLTVS